MSCANFTNNINVKHYILAIRLTVCSLLFLTFAVFKLVNINHANKIKDWVSYQLNDSLIAPPEEQNSTSYMNIKNIITPKILVNIAKPLEKGTITSTFGERTDPFNRNIKKLHKGIDIGTDFGDSIFSSIPGNVDYAGYTPGYGKCVIINHGNNIKTLYAHCSDLIVYNGDCVNKNQKIAYVGSTGAATGPHLHFEVIINNINYDPKLFLDNIYRTKDETESI